MFNFLDEICNILDKGWSLVTVILKNFTDESKDTSPVIHKELIKILQDYKNNNFISETEYTPPRPQGFNSPGARFYGLSRIHKNNMPMHPIVSAFGTATYNTTKFISKEFSLKVPIPQVFAHTSKRSNPRFSENWHNLSLEMPSPQLHSWICRWNQQVPERKSFSNQTTNAIRNHHISTKHPKADDMTLWLDILYGYKM